MLDSYIAYIILLNVFFLSFLARISIAVKIIAPFTSGYIARLLITRSNARTRKYIVGVLPHVRLCVLFQLFIYIIPNT